MDGHVIIHTNEARRALRDGPTRSRDYPADEDRILDALGWTALRDSRERAVQIAVELEGQNHTLLTLLDWACQLLTTNDSYDVQPFLDDGEDQRVGCRDPSGDRSCI